MSLLGYVRLIRPSHAIFSVIAVALGAYVGVVLGGDAHMDLFIPEVAFAGLVTLLIMSGGFVINNYYDMNIDRANNRKSPIPDDVSPKHAFSVGYAMLTFGIISCAILLNVVALALAVCVALMVDFYSRVLKRYHTIWGNLATSIATSITYVFGWAAVLTRPTPQLLIALASMFTITLIATLAREFIKGIDDLNGDQEFEIEGLVAKVGPWRTSLISLGLFTLAMAMSLIPYAFHVFGIPYLVLMMSVNITALLATVFLLFKIRVSANPRVHSAYAHKVKNAILCAMAFGIVAFGVGLL